MTGDTIHDCIIIGAGPGGLQAAIYLGRFNRDVLLLDRGGGRTMHARHIENFLSRKSISGKEIIDIGMEQAKSFHVEIIRDMVSSVMRSDHFEVRGRENTYYSKYVIVASGVYDNLPPIADLHKFLGTSFFTCVYCDGYRTTRKKLIVLGNTIETVNLAIGMKEMYTDDVTLILYTYQVPETYREELVEEKIRLINGRPLLIFGEEKMEGLELKDGQRIECEVIMSNFGFKLNDGFLSQLNLKRDGKKFKYVTNHKCESSLGGLYIVGPLNTGNDQVVISAAEGAVAAIDINKRLLQ
jgi:thioredoxin reductase (NADPH)